MLFRPHSALGNPNQANTRVAAFALLLLGTAGLLLWLYMRSSVDGAEKPTDPLMWLAGALLSFFIALLIYTLIRERQLAEKHQRTVEAVLDAATEVAIVATDRQGTITVFNRGAEKMLGYRAEEMIARQTPILLHRRDEVEKRSHELTAECGHPVSGFEVFVTRPELLGAENRKWTYVRKDGSTIPVDLTVTPQRNRAGEITGYLGVAIDLTERIRAEDAARRQASLLQEIIDHIPGGVSLIDTELRFFAINRELCRLLDFPETLFAHGPPSLYEMALFNAQRGEYGPGDPHRLAESVVEKARHPMMHCFERTRPNGQTIEIRGAPLSNGGFVTIYTDVSDRKHFELELKKHRDRLQELVAERTARLELALRDAQAANAAKSAFLANMSHELRTPMHAILSFSEIGRERSADAGQEKLGTYFAHIGESAERLLALINDLLDLSRLEAGRLSLDPQWLDLTQVAERTCGQLSSLINEKAITLSWQLTPELPAIRADARRIEQVIHNLLANAIKFSPKRGRIEIDLRQAELPGGRRATDTQRIAGVALSISDQGLGIPEEELSAIFEPFIQSSRTDQGAGGSGLGLAISRDIVAMHRGSLLAANCPAGGSCFTLTLPIDPFSDASAEAPL